MIERKTIYYLPKPSKFKRFLFWFKLSLHYIILVPLIGVNLAIIAIPSFHPAFNGLFISSILFGGMILLL